MTFIVVRCPHCQSDQIVKRVTGCKFRVAQTRRAAAQGAGPSISRKRCAEKNA